MKAVVRCITVLILIKYHQHKNEMLHVVVRFRVPTCPRKLGLWSGSSNGNRWNMRGVTCPGKLFPCFLFLSPRTVKSCNRQFSGPKMIPTVNKGWEYFNRQHFTISVPCCELLWSDFLSSCLDMKLSNMWQSKTLDDRYNWKVARTPIIKLISLLTSYVVSIQASWS